MLVAAAIPTDRAQDSQTNRTRVLRTYGTTEADSVSEPHGHSGLGRRYHEAEALLEIELDGVGVVTVVADREVLARLESEIATRWLTTTAPSTPGAQTTGPSRILRRWSSSG
jgi:hypothetical protein